MSGTFAHIQYPIFEEYPSGRVERLRPVRATTLIVSGMQGPQIAWRASSSQRSFLPEFRCRIHGTGR